MHPIVDYQILQRNTQGYGYAQFMGRLPEEYSDHMSVFARAVREDDNLTIINWVTCTIDERNWGIVFNLPEGGLYRLEARATEKGCAIEWSPIIKNVYHVGVGDLFLLTGQSNMAGYGRDMAYDPPTLGVHLYANDGNWKLATHPLNDSINTIYKENSELCCGTSPALSFGRMMSKRLNVPIGLIQASLGGSALSKWHPEEDGTLYRAMLRRIDVVGNIGGVIWYQGCSDANDNDAPNYFKRFSSMVKLWREDLGNVPFVTVQLNRWVGGDEHADRMWGIIREAQRQAAKCINDVCIIPSIDLPINDGIHNSSGSNVIIGERMASALLKAHYHMSGALPPDVKCAVYAGNTQVMIQFEQECSAQPMDNSALGMNVEDEHGLILCERAEITDSGILITTERPYTLPANFHALWRCMPPACTPRDSVGMPMLSCYAIPIEYDEQSQG